MLPVAESSSRLAERARPGGLVERQHDACVTHHFGEAPTVATDEGSTQCHRLESGRAEPLVLAREHHTESHLDEAVAIIGRYTAGPHDLRGHLALLDTRAQCRLRRTLAAGEHHGHIPPRTGSEVDEEVVALVRVRDRRIDDDRTAAESVSRPQGCLVGRGGTEVRLHAVPYREHTGRVDPVRLHDGLLDEVGPLREFVADDFERDRVERIFGFRYRIEIYVPAPKRTYGYYVLPFLLGDPMVAEEHITAFGWAHPQDMDDIVALTLRVNDFLFGLFLGCGIKLIDFKIEFGRLYEDDMVRIVLADEISPDSCRLWDIKTQDKLDKDRFRRDMGGLVEAYQEVARRLGIIAEGEKPERTKPKLVKTDLN